MKTLFAILILAGGALAQQQVVTVNGPATQTINVYNGSNVLIANCTAYSVVTTGQRAAVKVPITVATQATPTVLTAVGHGFATGTRPSITISGVTGTGYTAINATWKATVASVDTFSVPFDSHLLAAPTLTNAVFTTTAPRSTIAEWAVRLFLYDTNSNLTVMPWLNGTSAYNQKCSDYSSTTEVLQ